MQKLKYAWLEEEKMTWDEEIQAWKRYEEENSRQNSKRMKTRGQIPIAVHVAIESERLYRVSECSETHVSHIAQLVALFYSFVRKEQKMIKEDAIHHWLSAAVGFANELISTQATKYPEILDGAPMFEIGIHDGSLQSIAFLRNSWAYSNFFEAVNTWMIKKPKTHTGEEFLQLLGETEVEYGTSRVFWCQWDSEILFVAFGKMYMFYVTSNIIVNHMDWDRDCVRHKSKCLEIIGFLRDKPCQIVVNIENKGFCTINMHRIGIMKKLDVDDGLVQRSLRSNQVHYMDEEAFLRTLYKNEEYCCERCWFASPFPMFPW